MTVQTARPLPQPVLVSSGDDLPAAFDKVARANVTQLVDIDATQRCDDLLRLASLRQYYDPS